VLALQALQELLLLSGGLAAAHAPAALAPLADADAPPALRLAAVRCAAALAARHPGRAPEALAALERLLLQELGTQAAGPGWRAAGGSGGQAPAGSAAPADGSSDMEEWQHASRALGGGEHKGAQPSGAGSAGGGSGATGPCMRGAGLAAAATGLAPAAAAAYARAIASDSLVLSPSAFGTLGACLLAADAAVAGVGHSAVCALLAASPPHAQRQLVVGLLAHAPPWGGGAPALARGVLARLLPEGLRGGEALQLSLVQVLASGWVADGAAGSVGGAAASRDEAGAGEGMGAGVAEACTALLEGSGAALAPKAMAALLAHLQVCGGRGVRDGPGCKPKRSKVLHAHAPSACCCHP
jgi:hypothetical protein